MKACLEATLLLVITHLEPDLNDLNAAVHDISFDRRAQFEKLPMLLLAAKAHHIFHPRSVVPTPIEDHDFAGGREMLHVTLQVHLRLLAVGRRRQRDEAEYPRAYALSNGLNRSAFAGRVAALEHDYHAQALVFHPFLEFTKLSLELAQFRLVLFALDFSFGRIIVHNLDLPNANSWPRASGRSRVRTEELNSLANIRRLAFLFSGRV